MAPIGAKLGQNAFQVIPNVATPTTEPYVTFNGDLERRFGPAFDNGFTNFINFWKL